jgi:hypothetical protein
MYTSSEETPSHSPLRENSIFEEKPSASTMKLWCTAAGALEVHTAVISAPVARCCLMAAPRSRLAARLPWVMTTYFWGMSRI